MSKLEVACFRAEDAKIALEQGAHRVEFCEDYASGGVTPKLDEFILLRSQFPEAKIHVMIRPREGDFVYSTYKIDIMKAQVAEFESAGADGFVFAALHSDNTINLEACREIIEVIKDKSNKKAVFHRAFDQVPHPEKALEQLVDLGFTGLLTSGGCATAKEGIPALKRCVDQVGNRLEIVVGGGVRSHNIDSLKKTGATWYHSAAWNKQNEAMDLAELQHLIRLI